MLSEHEIQSSFFRRVVGRAIIDKRWNLLYAIPNGGLRDVKVAKKLQAEGVMPGIPDIHLPVSSDKFHSLYVEFKKAGGRLSPDQRDRIALLRENGNAVQVARSADEAEKIVSDYLYNGRISDNFSK